ncbi:MAG: hypothetical protein LUH15_21330, partial [Tannerellaceae bacterium]|nr:hypothetical protein [Tannerellaceae bacterium]
MLPFAGADLNLCLKLTDNKELNHQDYKSQDSLVGEYNSPPSNANVVNPFVRRSVFANAINLRVFGRR